MNLKYVVKFIVRRRDGGWRNWWEKGIGEEMWEQISWKQQGDMKDRNKDGGIQGENNEGGKGEL